jgi:hypothetical protein
MGLQLQRGLLAGQSYDRHSRSTTSHQTPIGCAYFSPAAIVQQLAQLMQRALSMFTLCLASHTRSCKVSPHLVRYHTLDLTLQLLQTTSLVYAVSSKKQQQRH